MEKFVVSARKYRPITFESVVGQNHITSTLRNAIKRDQVAHAYLFCGPRGVGKTTCARILSKTLNCLSPLDNIEPCGECESCKAFEENRSFNIHELDAASNNSVENIRALNDQVRIAPQIGRYSIYIIDEAHMLSTAAFNAFLKTLEEPPAHAIFILATTEKHKILPTIISRCQIYDFKRIKVEDMVCFLAQISEKEGVTYDDESLHIISQKADGCMRDALSMYDKVVSFCGNNLKYNEVSESLNVLDYDSYFKFTELFSSGDYKMALLLFDEILQKGFDSMTFLAGLSVHLRNLLMAADNTTLPLLELTGTVAQRFAKQATTLSTSLIFDSLNIIASAESNARFSLNVRLHTEVTILKLCNLSPLKISQGSIDQKYTLPQITGGTTANQQAPQTTKVAETTPTSVQTSTPTKTPIVEKQTEVKVEKGDDVECVEKKSENIEPKVKAKPQRSSRSVLGVSIASMVKKEQKAAEPETQEVENGIDNNTDIEQLLKIDPSLWDSVLDGCERFAESLEKTRPRLASSFDNCKIEDGVLKIIVRSNIIRDDIESQRHSLTEELISFCNVSPLAFEIVVDELLEEKKITLLRDEDKLKYMQEKNSSFTNFCAQLNLDYV